LSGSKGEEAISDIFSLGRATSERKETGSGEQKWTICLVIREGDREEEEQKTALLMWEEQGEKRCKRRRRETTRRPEGLGKVALKIKARKQNRNEKAQSNETHGVVLG